MAGKNARIYWQNNDFIRDSGRKIAAESEGVKSCGQVMELMGTNLRDSQVDARATALKICDRLTPLSSCVTSLPPHQVI